VRSSPAVASSQPCSILAAAGDSPTPSRPLLGASLRLERKISAFFAAKSDCYLRSQRWSYIPIPTRCYLLLRSSVRAEAAAERTTRFRRSSRTRGSALVGSRVSRPCFAELSRRGGCDLWRADVGRSLFVTSQCRGASRARMRLGQWVNSSTTSCRTRPQTTDVASRPVRRYSRLSRLVHQQRGTVLRA